MKENVIQFMLLWLSRNKMYVKKCQVGLFLSPRLKRNPKQATKQKTKTKLSVTELGKR
jgi:hypothetical protein